MNPLLCLDARLADGVVDALDRADRNTIVRSVVESLASVQERASGGG